MIQAGIQEVVKTCSINNRSVVSFVDRCTQKKIVDYFHEDSKLITKCGSAIIIIFIMIMIKTMHCSGDTAGCQGATHDYAGRGEQTVT